ncbi:MAG: NAD-dependent epimerase/dehydratase family protein [Myxococcota bacterium]|nr:NAD-dependent epimerase/dehydratase family protein [Myxococcota bacterium]
MKVLVTGSSGLIGSEAVRYYDAEGHHVIGADNNMRQVFFGAGGDTTWNRDLLLSQTRTFEHRNIDIRDRTALFELFETERFDLIVHCAAQPSHDKAADIPLIDFDVNAVGTINLLEATRRHTPNAVFIHMSTNKVYGDAPNSIPIIETESRYEYARPEDYAGVAENFQIDRCMHSVFGASKVAADIMAQEYGRYFGTKVGIFRGGCLTGPAHSGVELHGFLAYLIKVAVTGRTYRVFGYKGKQVRDNIHSYDVIQAFEAFRKDPKPGEVYNLGGGRNNSISILEAFALVESLTGRKVHYEYVDENRKGDHICYISDLTKMKSHFKGWDITRSIEDIFQEIINAVEDRA